MLIIGKLRRRCDLTQDGSHALRAIDGVDAFLSTTGEVRSDGADDIACWIMDTNNEESFLVRHPTR